MQSYFRSRYLNTATGDEKRLDRYAPGTAVRGALQDAVEEVPRPELTRIQTGATTDSYPAIFPVTRTKHNNRMHNNNNQRSETPGT